MNRVESPQMVTGFFGILMSKPAYKVWDLEHFPMLQKSTDIYENFAVSIIAIISPRSQVKSIVTTLWGFVLGFPAWDLFLLFVSYFLGQAVASSL